MVSMTDAEHAKLTGRLTELWMKYAGNGTNSDILTELAAQDDLSVEVRVYGGFIHGIEVCRSMNMSKEHTDGEADESGSTGD